MYQIGEKVVHPVHGACQILNICQREGNATEEMYYVLEPTSEQGMILWVPAEHTNKNVGLRKVISKEQSIAVMKMVRTVEIEWIKDHKVRHLHYAQVIKEGDFCEMAKLYKELIRKEAMKQLPLSEKEMLNKLRKKLISEMMVSQAITLEMAMAQLNDIWQDESESLFMSEATL